MHIGRCTWLLATTPADHRAMNNVQLLLADRQRHEQALDAALQHTPLLRQQVERAHLRPSARDRDLMAVRVLMAPDGPLMPQLPQRAEGAAAGGGGGVPHERPQAAQQEQQQQQEAEQSGAAQQLLGQAKLQHALATSQRLHKLQAGREALRVAASALDKSEQDMYDRQRGRGVSLADAIADDARLARLGEAEILAEFRERSAAAAKRQQQLQRLKPPAPAGARAMRQPSGARAAPANGGGRAVDQEEGAAGGGKGPGGGEAVGLDGEPGGEDQGPGWAAANGGRDDAGGDGRAGGGGGGGGGGGDGGGSPYHGFSLDEVAEAVKAALPAQQAHLAGLKRAHAIAAKHLEWQQRRPTTYAGDAPATAQQRSLKGTMRAVVLELVESALHHVAREVAEWRAGQREALMQISRHLGESVLSEVVDEMIAEAWSEADGQQGRADAFAFDLLVAAVAFSQGKNDVVAQTRTQPRARRIGRMANEAALVLKAAVSQAGRSDILRQRVDAQGNPIAGGGEGGGGGGREERGLYLAGLKAMLSEMRARRPPDTPFGHTQQLQAHFRPGARVAKAQRLAIGRMRPPLAAAPSVWARRQEPAARLDHAPWPGPAHAAAAAAERAF
ncbi:MAG: hypothetical protein J3K34DRAFT_525878 [Monoraphidium minutum]|nr:MAG: hypothetical protein J3K34DRAFT_525878 [Monoraphidium minutum]